MKPFAYVNAANEKEAVAALGTERGRILPMAGGMDLLGLMKDFIVSLNLFNTYDNRPPNPRAETNDIGIVFSLGWTY